MADAKPLESYTFIVVNDSGRTVGEIRHLLPSYTWSATAFCCGAHSTVLPTFFDALAFIEDDAHCDHNIDAAAGMIRSTFGLDNCPDCGRRITDLDESGCESPNGQRYCLVHLPDDVIDQWPMTERGIIGIERAAARRRTRNDDTVRPFRQPVR